MSELLVVGCLVAFVIFFMVTVFCDKSFNFNLYDNRKHKYDVVLMCVEYGCGSETFDFNYKYVIVDKNKKIIRGSYLGFFRKMFDVIRFYDYTADYGFGYSNAHQLSADFNSKRITI